MHLPLLRTRSGRFARIVNISRPRLLLLTLATLLLSLLLIPSALANPTTVSGIVYRDYDANSAQDALPARREPGVPGIMVRAFGPGDAPIASTVTSDDGTYTLIIPVAAGTEIRVEFDVPVSGFQSGPYGSGGSSTTTVTFVRTPATGINLGINRPGQYCQSVASTIDLATSCYIFGNQETITEPVVVDVPYEGGAEYVPGRPGDDYNRPGLGVHDLKVAANQVGTTWGLAYQRSTRSLFAGAFMKRHAGLGPGGTGAIYRIDATAPDGNPSLFLDLNVLFGPGTTGINPRPAGGNVDYYLRDPDAWDTVGKMAFGDLDMFEDDQTLYTVNLADRQLYEIPVGSPPVAPTAAQISRFPIPRPCAVSDDTRPFGLGVYDGFVYVGLVCSAESTFGTPGFPQGDPSQLSAYVYSFDPLNDTFAEVLSFPLDYPHGCMDILANGSCNADGRWQAWRPLFGANRTFTGNFGILVGANPQPWLVGIEFDNGDMILGFRDRFGDQFGSSAYSPDPGDFSLYASIIAGDLLRACRNTAGTWVLENNAQCGGYTTAGRNSQHTSPLRPQGPGGGEYYFDDWNLYDDEVGAGGLAQVAGEPEVASVVIDPRPDQRTDPPVDESVYDGGIRFFTNTTSNAEAGRLTRLYRLYDEPFAPPTVPPVLGSFGKSNGLGDLELMCNAAPIEIGNRVWYDLDANGRQDPGEPPVVGVTLRLYQRGVGDTHTLVGTTSTNEAGEYIFNAVTVPGGVQPNTDYEIRIDNSDDYTNGPLRGWTATKPFMQAGMRDSDGIWSGEFVSTTLRTGPAGYNNHTYDFGFIQPTAIDLVRFTAIQQNNAVLIEWETAAERDTWGFQLYRSASGDRSDAVRITPELIAGRGRGQGARYSWRDTTAEPGTHYRYWLQETEINGSVNEYGPAVIVTPAGAPYQVFLPLAIAR